MVVAKTRVQAGDIISATLMNDILEQLEKIQGGTPTDLAQLMTRLQQLEAWRAAVDPAVGKVNGIDARLAVAESSLTSLSGLAGNVSNLQQALTALTARVAALEALAQQGGRVRINGFDPPVQVPMDQVLTILGTGFKSQLVENLVFLNDTPIYNYRLDSDSSRLKIVIPHSIPNVTPTPGGTQINIRVANDDGEATATYKVTPSTLPTGTPPGITSIVDVNQGQVTGTILHPNHTARVTGQGLWSDFHNQATATARFIYKTPSGPAIYPVTNLNFGSPHQLEFDVPDIREAPTSGVFEAILEIARSTFVPALAAVTMSRV